MLGFLAVRRASDTEEHLSRYLWLLLAVTNAVDLLASKRAFELGIAELNPAAEMLISTYGVWGLALFKASWIVVLALLIPFIRGWTQVLLGLCCLVYVSVIFAHIAFLSPLL